MLTPSSTSHERVPLAAVLQTRRLFQSPARSRDPLLESRAIARITRHLASSPRSVMDAVAGAARELCQADSAGLSVLATPDAQVFRRMAIAGAWASYVDTTAPRAFSPYGAVIDTGGSQLFCRPDRYFGYLTVVHPPVVEVLLTPFAVDGRLLGAVWVALHDDRRQFDGEDERRLARLAQCASAVHQVALTLDDVGSSPSAPARLALGLAQLNELISSLEGAVADGLRPDAKRTLSQREFEVVCLVAQGHTNKAIATALDVNIKSIETYRARATDKLGFRNRADFLTYVQTQGWLAGAPA